VNAIDREKRQDDKRATSRIERLAEKYAKGLDLSIKTRGRGEREEFLLKLALIGRKIIDSVAEELSPAEESSLRQIAKARLSLTAERRLEAITRWIAAGTVSSATIPEAWRSLALLDAFLPMIDPKNRDPLRAATPKEIEAAIPNRDGDDALVIPPGKKRTRAKNEETLRSEPHSRIALESENCLVIIPKTREAAEKWGRGTRWCTTSADGRAFRRHARAGELVIIIERRRRKSQKHEERPPILVQLHAASRACMDSEDRPAEPADILGALPELADVPEALVALVAVSPELLADETLRRKLMDERLSELIVSIPDLANAIPIVACSRELLRKTLPRSMQALRRAGRRFVDEKLIDAELLSEILDERPGAYGVVVGRLSDELEEVLDEKRAIAFVENGHPLADVPFGRRTRKTCEAAVKASSRNIQFIPAAIMGDPAERDASLTETKPGPALLAFLRRNAAKTASWLARAGELDADSLILALRAGTGRHLLAGGDALLGDDAIIALLKPGSGPNGQPAISPEDVPEPRKTRILGDVLRRERDNPTRNKGEITK
jgi:hypothetical protein